MVLAITGSVAAFPLSDSRGSFAAAQESGTPAERRYALPKGVPASDQAWVMVRLDKTAGTVAERYRLEIEASGPAGWSASWPAVEESVGDFAVAAVEEKPERGVPDAGVERGTRLVHERVYTLEPFLAGKRTIPAMTFTFKNDDPAHVSVISISTEPIDTEVASVLELKSGGGAPALEPMRGVVDPEPERGVPVWVIAAGGAVIVSLAGVALVAARRRRGTAVAPLAAAEAARSRLIELAELDLPAFGTFEEHYTALADILRGFAAARFGLADSDRTTEELLAELAGVPGAEVEELRRLLGHLDEVKFAGVIPTAATAQQAYDGVARYVEEHAADAPGDESGTDGAADGRAD